MIRATTVADAEAVEGVHTRARVHAYADFIAPEHFTTRPAEERVSIWRDRLRRAPVATWVWDQGGRVAGFVSAGEADEPDLDGRFGCVRALYVDPPAQGAGVGTGLVAHAEEQMRRRGCQAAVLWVFAAHEHGRRFYERREWRAEAATEHQAQEWAAPALRYRKPL